MFHEGDLQSGISRAVQESKLVACFVTDDGDESNRWENEFLSTPELQVSLSAQAVLLRLKAGSTEAGHLAALFPLPKIPTIVMIKNGQLKEYFAAGISKDDFMRRMKTALEAPQSPPSPRTLHAGETSARGTEASSSTSSTSTSTVSETHPSGINPTVAAPVPRKTTKSPADLLAERKARLQQQDSSKESEKKQENDPKGKGKAPAGFQPVEEPTKKQADPAEMKYALMQKKRQQEAREERARILKRVEDDKAQRRQDAVKRKAEKAAAEVGGDAPALATVPSPSSSSGRGAQITECAVQVRLFDGSTIRSRFPSNGKLRTHVRPWIDEKQGDNAPYTFKQVLTPLPNKNISISEEDESLQSLGLTPSATLILIPVEGYTLAYEGAGATGVVYRGAAVGYNLVSSSFGLVTGLLGGILGSGTAGSAQEPSAQQDAPPRTATPSSSIRVKTLADQRKDDNQFYNGNALNFEPRKDEDDRKED